MGEAICRLFAKEGAKVVVADYNFEGAEKVASEINTETPDAATAIKTDVSIETDINAMIDTAITFFADCSPWINPGGSKGCWDVTDRTGDISKKVEMSFFYFRSIPKSP